MKKPRFLDAAMKEMRFFVVVSAVMTLLTSSVVYSAPLVVSFIDPVGDFQNENIDLIGMTLEFNDLTGAYKLTVNFDDANPFSGTFNVNANLLNGNISPLTTTPAFVGINEIPTAAIATTELVFTGTEPNLTSWQIGDTIANDSSIFGIPIDASFSSFVSGVQDGGLGIDILDSASSTVTLVPIPPAILLFGSGLIGLVLLARRKQTLSN